MDYEFNAFTEGVSPGGLRSTNQIKLLIEYLVTSLDEPLTADTAVEALTVHMLANYFEAAQAVDELIANESLTRDENDVLTITEKGTAALGELIGELPVSVRERAMSDAAAIQMKKRIEGTTSAEIVETENGFNVICKILHREKILMELTLHAVDYEQADKIRSNFNDNPAGIYGQLISMLY